MSIHFVGAGPGAPDLITLRGFNLLRACRICVYAGSVVNPELLAFCPLNAEKIDSASLSLEQLMEVFQRADDDGLDVVRLHSGDLSVWSAVAEQMRILRAAGIDYTLTPGVPAFAAAAAVLETELTLPEVTQSVVLTRTPGRASSMPPAESLRNFAVTGATLAIHLSIHKLDEICTELLPHYGTDCPAAVVFRAGWPEERVVKAPLAMLAAAVASRPIERSALILIGRALDCDDFKNSALYDASYQRRFRGRAD